MTTAAAIERLEFGRTGHASSRVIFGAAALGGMRQEKADGLLELVMQAGINHIDTAASYGDSELRLAPFLKDPDRREDRMLVWHYPHYHGSTWRPGSAIRDNQWKLIEFYEDSSYELYDLSNDLSEQKDLSGVYPQLADSLRMNMHQRLQSMGAGYPVLKQ